MNEAGPELDSLVARYVWGYVIIIDTHTGENYIMSKSKEHMPVPPFSTDLQAAYQVTEKMNAIGFTLQLKNVVENGESKWITCFARNDGRKYIPVISKSLPAAICLAALAAAQGKNIYA